MTFESTIPVLNEATTLDKQVRKLHAFLRQHFPKQGQWRIVIADNGSTDATPALATALAHELEEVVSLRLAQKGVGLALKNAWFAAKADIVGYMDLDLATDLVHFPEAYRAISEDGFDLVYGTRLHPEALVLNRTQKREIASRGFNFILKRYLGVQFSDGMCGFKFLRRSILDDLYKHGARNDGWFFATELLTVGEWLEYRLYELPVKWTDDPDSSKVRILPLARKYLKSMYALKKEKRKWKL